MHEETLDQQLTDILVIEDSRSLRSTIRPLAKRLVDIIVSVILFLFILPLSLLIVLILIATGQTPFYSNVRIGRGGREFGCLKFRSMRRDADAALADLLARDPVARSEWQATRKLRRDPRVTRVGKVLRATSLDELPQLLNVMAGQIYGRQEGPWPTVPNVILVGYVPDIKQAYGTGIVMVYPCLLAGGIKTKVLEAFAHGVPVVGNEATFESILPQDYPLVIDDEAALVGFLRDPTSHADRLAQAAHIISSYLEREHTARRFSDRWRDAILGSASPADAQELPLRLLPRGLMV